jgi:hypothetical protein
MTLYISKYKPIDEIQKEFHTTYPFLKIEFEKKNNVAALPENMPENAIEIAETTTVQQLRKAIKSLFGIPVQILRKSGKIWLETTMTENWTLVQQNQHGEEISAWSVK